MDLFDLLVGLTLDLLVSLGGLLFFLGRGRTPLGVDAGFIEGHPR